MPAWIRYRQPDSNHPTPLRAGKGPAPSPPLTILHAVAPAHVGGLERVVCALAAGHTAAGHRVHVAAILAEDQPAHPFVRALTGAGVEVHLGVVHPRDYIGERAFLAWLCQGLSPAVVHTHGYRPDVVDAPVARRLGIPTVTTVHGFVRGSWKGRVYEWLQRRAYRRFDAVAAVSHPQVDEIVAAGVRPDRVHLIPNAWGGSIPTENRMVVRSELGVPDTVFHVGWVGRLSHEKGADILVRALAHCSDLPVVVTFVGDGSQLQSLKELASSTGVSGRVRWQGFVEDASRLFPSFDAFVLSSRTEGTPIALLEAMAARVPVIATRVGGVPDVVTSSEALLVPSESPTAIASMIHEVIAHPDPARERVEAASARLSSAFAYQPWLDRYLDLYTELNRTRD